MYDYEGGLFGCFKDITGCLFSMCCAPCSNGENWAKVRDEECTWCHVCMVVHPYWVRKSVLKKRGESGSNVADCLITTFCAECVICQDRRELISS
ncbi:putative Cys-rich domain containing protein [Trichomonas vaginalis G3]|uniref:Uncharacterized Cys-rich domain containing protein n=1 Tax=Trichomonas vaginalis (strain ATCC PRA-98 / G3) TaxID=412133 RepID=A2G4K2_TRIV3|nr:uncharacterized protein TVAGG3_0422690 [Trichomonas vaginalis G3]EAX87914.1 putative Cys-rich domain containing protein [Trichomonas vaginalis G3]KAI5536180.1 PLAC8 family [Trichomonas vaginalis G3]|eukprot:XP_001300844.1 hypothetical protein [Trichomonas vaginalis G3]